MISVIVYGRNDAHGYNLHRRAALSLNCIACVLTDPDDEIIVVDYNSPPEMPVFPEAIRDTLTSDALRRLRVIRVPASVHTTRFGARTHLAALEPVARNVALRRSNPANRWVLATNTDMVFVPSGSHSLSEIVAGLPDAYWGIPRFQLPEALWERLDRGMPEAALATIGSWGTRFQLDESVTTYEWMGFDAPGDFQLVPREWLWALDGFDEAMVLGWHVDTNLARRLSLAYGPPGDLQARVRGYHCDHTRVPGVFHGGEPVENDVEQFVFGVDRSDLPSQSETWGLADLELEELDLSSTIASRLPGALEVVVPGPTAPLPAIDARAALGSFAYAAPHVLPYVASALSVLPSDAVIGYVGANPELVTLLAALLPELGFESLLRVLATGPGLERGVVGAVPTAQVEIARDADAIVVDFGLPVERAIVPEPVRISDWTFDDRRVLDRTLEVFDQLTRLDATAAIGARPLRNYVVVNAVYNIIEGTVDARLSGGGKQFATRVRQGHPRIGDANGAAPPLPRLDVADPSRQIEVRYEVGQYVDVTQLDRCSPYLVGEWAWVTPIGTWTDGRRAGFVFDVDPAALDCLDEAVFTLRVDRAFDERRSGSRVVDVEIAGERVDRWHFSAQDFHPPLHRVCVSRELLGRERPIRIDLVVHEASSPPGEQAFDGPIDPGLQIVGACLAADDAPLCPGDRVEVSEDPPLSIPLFWSGWSWPEDDGVWSVGPLAVLRVPPLRSDAPCVQLDIELADVFVRPGQDPLEVEVVVDGGPHERWSFDRAGPHVRHLMLEARDVPTSVTLKMPAAVSGHDLGESADRRRLGCKIAAIAVAPDADAPTDPPRSVPGSALLRRLRGARRRSS